MYPSALVTLPWPLVDTVRVYSGANVADDRLVLGHVLASQDASAAASPAPTR